MPEMKEFPSNFGKVLTEEPMVEWDIAFPWSGRLPGFMQEVYDQSQKLPLPRPGYRWQLVSQDDRPVIYNAISKEAALHWAQVRERQQ